MTSLNVFFDFKGFVHHEYNVMTNAKFYVEMLKRLKRRVHRAPHDRYKVLENPNSILSAVQVAVTIF